LTDRTLVQRVWRWIICGGVCSIVQLMLLQRFTLVMPHYGAAWLAYVLGGQLNFVLSSTFIWNDRHTHLHGKQLVGALAWCWCKYTCANVSAGIVNSAIQVGCRHFGAPLVTAFIVGNVMTPCVNFGVQHFVVFRHKQPIQKPLPELVRGN
jgi:putative flippase GtrA